MTATLSGGEIILWEFIGTAVLILFGAGVVATVLLPRTNSDGDTASWVLITIGWGVAVFAGASIAHATSGHINPAVTISLAIAGKTLETIKSIEVVTGPGGVLWGANSFLGIVNLISKDADDINGLEAGIGYGDGDGSPRHESRS